MGKNKVISKQTWQKLFAIRNYQEFIQEWLNLYDAFFAVNPSIPHELEMDCMKDLFQGFGVKWVDRSNEEDVKMIDISIGEIFSAINLKYESQ